MKLNLSKVICLTLVAFASSIAMSQSQIDLPVNFESATVNYTMTSFGGNVDSLITDPTNPANKVMRVIKPSGAQTWAGTTIGTPTGFATDIAFSANDTLMTVRVWSPAAGVPIRLKVEDADTNTHTCETETLTTIAGGWETIVFNFANEATGTASLSTGLANGWDFNKASIFFDFNTTGAQDTFYFDDVMFGLPPLAQIDVPVTFEGITVDYTMTDFGGNASMKMTDPTDPANTVMRVIKTTGAQTWAGTTIGTPTGFATDLPFSANDTLMTVRVWSPTAGTPIRLKVEDADTNTHTCETETLTTIAGGWETIVFNFANEATGTASLSTGLANGWDFNKASIFFDFNTTGAQDTFYFDDVMFGPPPAAPLSQIDVPVTFEGTAVDYTMTDFGGNASMKMTDPTDPANTVMRVIKPSGAQTWAGTTIGTPIGFANDLPFSANDTLMTVRVWSPTAGTPIRLKVEDADTNTHTCETETLTTIAGGWETIVFNFANEATGTASLSTGLANGWDFNKASIFFDFNTTGAQDTFYFDDVMFGPPAAAPLNQIDVPVTFEGTTIDYTMTDFGGNASMKMTDPTDPANTVMRVIKPSGAQTWAGTTIGTAAGFANDLPFSSTDTRMNLRIWSPRSGVTVRLKVEDADTNTHTCETEAITTMNGGWDTLTFDFANQAAGTPTLASGLANGWDFNKASLFYDFGNTGAQDTLYFDDVMFGGMVTPPPPPSGLTQVDLPVHFEDTTVDRTVTDFGGNVSTLVKDPTDSTNHVIKVEKTSGAQTWAGTTIGTDGTGSIPKGFINDIPLTMTNSFMSVRVWSPDSNTVVRLKVEDADTNTHTCETEATTTKNGEWEILIFDFTNEATGTASLSTGIANGWNFNAASLFFDFGNTGTGKVYYFDDVRFGKAFVSNNEIEKNDIVVYPNPTDNQWNINAGENMINQIDVYDLKGNLVQTINPNSTTLVINATRFVPGMYILRTTTNKGVSNQRIIKN